MSPEILQIKLQVHEASGGPPEARCSVRRDEASLNAYLSGEVVTGFKTEPTVKDISAEVFDVVEDMSRKTRGPIKEALPV
jgi:hypothetical protein